MVHLGDNCVPNALTFLDKYSQIPWILNPILQVRGKDDWEPQIWNGEEWKRRKIEKNLKSKKIVKTRGKNEIYEVEKEIEMVVEIRG